MIFRSVDMVKLCVKKKEEKKEFRQQTLIMNLGVGALVKFEASVVKERILCCKLNSDK